MYVFQTRDIELKKDAVSESGDRLRGVCEKERKIVRVVRVRYSLSCMCVWVEIVGHWSRGESKCV